MKYMCISIYVCLFHAHSMSTMLIAAIFPHAYSILNLCVTFACAILHTLSISLAVCVRCGAVRCYACDCKCNMLNAFLCSFFLSNSTFVDDELKKKNSFRISSRSVHRNLTGKRIYSNWIHWYEFECEKRMKNMMNKTWNFIFRVNRSSSSRAI